eukprot:jgi/Tetstr1/434349/TSEL_023455.t1
MALTLEEKRARNRAYAAKYREKNRERTRERYAEKMKDPAFQESERVRALEKYYRTRSLDVKPVGRPRKHVYTPEQESRFERAKEERAKEMSSRRPIIDVLPLPRGRSAAEEAAFLRSQFVEAARDATLRQAAGMAPLPLSNREAALRRANFQRRAAAAERRRALQAAGVRFTPSGRRSRAMLTTDERAAKRRRVLAANVAASRGFPLSFDIADPEPRRVLTDQDRSRRRAAAAIGRRIAAARAARNLSIAQRARGVLVRRFVPPRFPSVRAAAFTADTAAQVANSVRAELYRVLYGGERRSHKVWVNIEAAFTKGAEETLAHLNMNRTIHGEEDILDFARAVGEAAADPEKYPIGVGSGWAFAGIRGLQVNANGFRVRTGAGHVPLPKPYDNSRSGLINIQNDDDLCFKYCIIAALHPPATKPTRIDYYVARKNQRLYDAYDWTGVKFPTAVKDVRRFEANNPELALNCFMLNEETNRVTPLSITTAEGDRRVINMLLYKKHWVLISSMDRLFNSRGDQRWYCERCLHGFKTPETRAAHNTHCAAHKPMLTSLPPPDKASCGFKALHKSMAVPIVIYADSEAINAPIDERSPSGKTARTSEHRCISIRARVESRVTGYASHEFQCTGADAADQFVAKLNSLRPELVRETTRNIPMVMTRADKEAHASASTCCECKKEFGRCINTRKVAHHDHKTGKYIGACHSLCNFKMQLRKVSVPVYFHNGKGYDIHFILNAIGRIESIDGAKLEVIPDNSERYKEAEFRGFRYTDTMGFMAAGLGALSKNLIGGDPRNAARFHRAFAARGLSAEEMEAISRKGVFPYAWFDGTSKLEHPALPSQAEFRNDITGEECSDADYRHAEWVWRRFGCTTFRDYHDLYLKADVLLLADVFESFRDTCMRQYNLDPCNYVTLPGMCWDGAMRTTKDAPELITDDISKYLHFERAIRGGVSMVTRRHAKANNPMCPDYDRTKPTSFITYLDANNLYGWAMMQYLPCSGFTWAPQMTLEEVLAGDWDGARGCSVEVDLEYPTDLHDAHSDLPLAPEKLKLGWEDASPTARAFKPDGCAPHEKLVSHFRPRRNYVCDARLLQFYVGKGLRVTKLHKAMVCQQAQVLAPWIEKNTKLRAASTNDFEKDLFKLCNNAVFGKTMQNVRAQSDYTFVTSDAQLQKKAADPRFRRCDVLGNIAGVDRVKDSVVLDKPIYMGAAILDLSKLLMFRFHYDVIKARYGAAARLLFTDTDSLCYHIETDDVYADMGQMAEHFDTSGYPKEHPLYSAANKKVVGKFKDETDGVPIGEFVGLKSKMYCFTLADDAITTKRTAKGIKKAVAKQKLDLPAYKASLGGAACTVTQRMIQSRGHRLCTVEATKAALSPYDDKRWICADGVTTRPHGHFRNADAGSMAPGAC